MSDQGTRSKSNEIQVGEIESQDEEKEAWPHEHIVSDGAMNEDELKVEATELSPEHALSSWRPSRRCCRGVERALYGRNMRATKY